MDNKAMAQEATEGESASKLSNDTGNEATTSGQPSKNPYRTPEELPWIPVRKWGPDGKPIPIEYVQEESHANRKRRVVWLPAQEGSDLLLGVPAGYSSDESTADSPVNNTIEVKADDFPKVESDEKHNGDSNLPMGEAEGPAKQDAEGGVAPVAEQVALEGNKLLSEIPINAEPRSSPDSIGPCSPFCPEPPRDWLPSPCARPPTVGAAALFGGDSSESTSAKDEQLAVDQKSKSSDSFEVLKDGNDGDGEEVKDDKEMAESEDKSAEGSSTPAPPKKTMISGLTLALQMEAAKKAMAQEATEGESASKLSNDAGNEATTSGQPSKNPYRTPEELPWIPVRKWGPDGKPIPIEYVQEDSHANRKGRVLWLPAQEGSDLFLGVPAGYSSDESTADSPVNDTIEVEQPNMWQRCYMWCGRMLCCRDYEQL